jgi:hypothetical protein
MDRMEALPVIGADLYCEFCRRQLVTFRADGSFNLAGLAVVRGSAEQTIDEYGDIVEPEEMVITEATCFRRSCRLKRFAYAQRSRLGRRGNYKGRI